MRVVQVFKTKPFDRFARKALLDDAALCGVVANIERGLIDADLGGGVLKQRVARRGGGKSGGFRVLIVYRLRDRAIFVDGFAKSDRANVLKDELAALKGLAALFLAYREAELSRAVSAGILIEVRCDGQGA